jgi:hypothetical protein
VSNAYFISRYCASVDTGVRLSSGENVTEPTSITPLAGSMRISASVPTARFVARSITVQCSGSALAAAPRR